MTLEETPDRTGAFPRLQEFQIAQLSSLGETRQVAAGEVLYREGERCQELHVVLSGTVALTSGDELVSVHRRGRFLGGLGLLTGQPMFLTAVVREPGEVLVVAVRRLLSLCEQDGSLAELVLRAFLARRAMLLELGTGLRIVGSRYSPDTRRLRDFAARNRLPHRWLDLEEDREAELLLRRLGIRAEDTPVVLWDTSKVLRNPTNAELAEQLGLSPQPDWTPDLCDVVIVGCGPAGLAAAVYASSEGLDTVSLDSTATGGQAGTSSRIENYLGFPAGISGAELAERGVVQAQRFGAQLRVPAEATALSGQDGHWVVRLDDGEVAARTVLVCTGVHYKRLPVPELERYEGKSVFYAATLVEAQLCGSNPVAVVGGGNSAGQAALFLATAVSPVRLVVREDDLGEHMSRYLVDRIDRNRWIRVMTGCEVRELRGEPVLQAIVVEHLATGERELVETRSLFVFIGASPHVGWLAGQVDLDDQGFVVTGRAPRAGLLETSLPGVFAAGDVRSGSTRRVASAVGEGALSIRLVHEHLSHRDVPADRPVPAGS